MTQQWRFDEYAWRFAVTRKPEDKRFFLDIGREVLADQTVTEILEGLEKHAWVFVLPDCAKRGVLPRFTNNGFAQSL